MKSNYLIVFSIILIIIGATFWVVYLHNPDNTKVISKVQYTCPMHPQIMSDKPGSCPICGMELVPINNEDVKERDNKKEHEHAMPEGYAAITLSKKQAAMLGIRYETVGIKEIIKEIVTSATIVSNEEKTFKINIKVSGWVEKLYVNQTGQYLKKGSPLFAIYSPELYAGTLEYISIINSIEQLGADEKISDVLVNLKKATRDKLKLYGLIDKQIDEIEKTKQSQRLIQIFAPYSGYVIEKNIYEGQKVMPDDTLMTIIDLSTVWALADIYQPDLPYVKVGMPALFKIPYWENKEYKGIVQFIYPFVNEQTRTVKVRVVLHNNGMELKPGLYAELLLRYSAGKHIAVSDQSVFKTGEKNYVFMKMDDGVLMPKEVVLGISGSNGYYAVLRGIKKGDVIVSPANFLIDSESQLKAYFSNVAESHQH